jgi:hypothetical protein
LLLRRSLGQLGFPVITPSSSAIIDGFLARGSIRPMKERDGLLRDTMVDISPPDAGTAAVPLLPTFVAIRDSIMDSRAAVTPTEIKDAAIAIPMDVDKILTAGIFRWESFEHALRRVFFLLR